MNLAECYSLAGGQKLEKIYTNEKFFPLPFDDFICFAPISKPAKNYQFFEEVISLILPNLNKLGLKIVQVGGKDEKAFNGCYHTQGNTNFGQLEYLISKAKLVLSTDTVAAHLAGHYNIPLVSLVSNNYKSSVQPYFGDKSKQIILEPDRTKLKPSFMLDEGPNRQIDKIPPSDIAKAVCKLLGKELDYPFTQLWLGQFHAQSVFELIPDCNINPQQIGVQSIAIRMDFLHSEEFLDNQLNICPCSIITKSPITLDLLKKHKGRIQELIYFIDETHNPKFIESAQRLGLNRIVLASRLPEDQLNRLKLDYLDLGLIQSVPIITKNSIPEIQGIDNLHYRTRKFTISKGQIFPSKAAWLANLPITLTQLNTLPVIDNDEFWLESNHFCILTKTS